MRAALRSARWVVLVVVVVGALGGLLLDLQLDRSAVTSTAQLEVSDASGAPASSDSAATMDSYIAKQLPTYAALATSDDVLEAAASSTGTTADALGPEVTASAVPDSRVLAVAVRAATPAAATAEADAITRSLSSAIRQVETPANRPPRVVVTTTTPPTTPAERFVPPMGALTALGALAGALVVLLGAMGWATGLPQRGWRAFSAWMFRRPSEAELVRARGTDMQEYRPDPEPLRTVANRWLGKLRHRD